METQYVSLGTLCHTAQLLKNIGLRKEAMPFDWVFSSPFVLMDCLKTKFSVFRDVKQHCRASLHKSGHISYGTNFFNHKDITCENDLKYYERAISRFTNIEENAVFVIGFYNNSVSESNIDYTEKSVELIQNSLKQYFNGKQHLLVCIHHKIDKKTYCLRTKRKTDHLLWVDVCCSETNGLRFLEKQIQKCFEKDMKKILTGKLEDIESYEHTFNTKWFHKFLCK